jgi:UPF0716 protein FxsA
VRFLMIFFIIIPLTEMLILFEVADRIGGLVTLSLVVATAVIGVQILKSQGLATLTRANQRLQSGELPAQEIVEGMMLAGAGALLLTPGFITDTIGFVFLTGPLRRPLARKIIKSGVVKSMGAGMGSGAGRGGGSSFSFYSSTQRYGNESPGNGSDDSANVFEGDYSEESGALEQNLQENDDDSHNSR